MPQTWDIAGGVFVVNSDKEVKGSAGTGLLTAAQPARHFGFVGQIIDNRQFIPDGIHTQGIEPRRIHHAVV